MALDLELIDRLLYENACRPDNADEISMIRQARNAVCYGGTTNSLISWMISPEWEQIPAEGPELLACSGTIMIKPTQEDT